MQLRPVERLDDHQNSPARCQRRHPVDGRVGPVEQVAQNDDNRPATGASRERAKGNVEKGQVDEGVAGGLDRLERETTRSNCSRPPARPTGAAWAPAKNVRLTGSPLARATRASAAATTPAKAILSAGAPAPRNPIEADASTARHSARSVSVSNWRMTEAIVPEQSPAVQPSRIVAGHVFAKASELDPSAPQRAPMHSCVEALGDFAGAKAKRCDFAPIDGAPQLFWRGHGIDTSGGSGPPSWERAGSRMARASDTSLSSSPVPLTTWRSMSSPPLVSPETRQSMAA